MFLTGMSHGLIVSTLPKLAIGQPVFPLLPFEAFGLLAIMVLLPLFLTSNLYSQQHLGKNWKRIHKLVYLSFWLIMLHTGLQGEMGFTLLVGATGMLEIVSLVVDWKKKKILPVSMPPAPMAT
jgi:DMSO/TMAO reductase YedYZ heme-binding membrane subunit